MIKLEDVMLTKSRPTKANWKRGIAWAASLMRVLLLSGTLLFVGSVWRAQASGPTLVQSAGHDNGVIDAPFCTATFPSGNTAGNLIVVAVEIGGTAAAHPVTVNDTQGNTYYPATSLVTWQSGSGGSSAQIFYAPNIRGGPNTVTMTEPNSGGTGAGNAFNQIAIHEYSGVSIASPLDVTAAAMGTTTSSPFTMSSGSATTAVNGELIFGYANALNATLTAGAGFTARQTTVGTSEDMVQTTAGPIAATAINSVNGTLYVMLMATFKPSSGSANGPVLPPQGNQSINVSTTLTVTNTAAEANTNPVTTSTILFTYANRAALLADGWNFIATNNGVARNTEITNPAVGPSVDYNQTNHPGTLRIPCDVGDLLGSANNTRNNLFRNLSTNWVSMRLALSFAPVTNYQQANLVLYQDDDNYVEVQFAYDSDLSSGQMVRIISEVNGQPAYAFTDASWYTGGPGTPPITNITLRLDRSLSTGLISAFSTVDGTNWPFVGAFGQTLVNPRLGIWVGASQVPYNGTQPNCDLSRLDVLTVNPPPALAYQLLSPPTGAGIDANGVIIWTPTSGQSPSTNTIKTKVTDNRVPALSATNSFTVTVAQPPPNTAPVLPSQTSRVVNELTLLTVTNTATDAQSPPQVLSYSLQNAPAGASIDTNGVITWTPAQTQSPSTNTITTVVTDNGIPPLSATNSFTVTVKEVNQAPVLPVQSSQTVFSQATLLVTNTASEPNIHSVTTGYGLLTAPTGASISTNGVITWTPSSAQIPSTNLITTVVTNSNPYDAVNPQLTATNSFTVFALPPTGPVLPVQTNQTVNELTTLTVTNTATYNGTATQTVTNTTLFTYTNRTALLADGWSFIGTNNGVARDTEVTNPAVGPSVDYNQTSHPGILRVPCDIGDLWGTDNTSRNSLFRNLSPNWVSMKLHLAFAPTQDVDQAHLGIYVDDDDYLDVGLAYNSTYGGETVPMVLEVNANPVHTVLSVSGITNIYLRMDQNATNSSVTGFYSLDNTNWVTIANYSQSFVNPRLVIWTGSSTIPWTNGAPNEDLSRLDVTAPGGVAPVLTYTLLNPPAGASISSSGVITWTPTEAQGPGTNVITTVVTDNSTPPLSATNSFTVVVNEVNQPPVLPTQVNYTNIGLATLIFTNTATDPDIPANPLTYQLLVAPTNATISTNGIITWTPTPAQLPSTNVFTTVVTDYNPWAVNSQHLSATNSFIVVAIPAGPVLPVQTSYTLNELTTLTVTNTAYDMSTALQVTTNTFLFTYTNRSALLADAWSFTATTASGQARPTEITNLSDTAIASYDQNAHPGELWIPCDPGDLWENSNNTTNSLFRNLPTNWLSAQLYLSFAPIPSQNVQQVHLGLYQNDDNYVQVGLAYNTAFSGEAATMDLETNGSASYSSFSLNSVTNIHLRLDRNSTNNAITGFYSLDGTNWVGTGTKNQAFVNPRLSIWVGGNSSHYASGAPIARLRRLDIIASNSVPTLLTYTLVNSPTNAAINANGVITWTPSQTQSPSTNVFTTVVTDNQVPPMSATNTFTVIVGEVNVAPVLPTIGPQTVSELMLLTVTNTATNANIHSVIIGYGLVNPPAGAVISANGIITWTPSQTQSPSTNTITTVVTNSNPYDGTNPQLTATNSFTVIVGEVNQAPVLPMIGPQTVNELTLLTVTNTASEPNIHSTEIGYGLLHSPSGAVISANGIITWTPSQGQSPSTNLFTTVVTNSNPYDGANPQLTATNSFNVVVQEVNTAPVLPQIGPQTVNELTLLSVTNTATNANIHSVIIGYGLINPPTGASISANGIITWTPSQAQSPSTNVITTVVTNSNPYDLVNPRLTATNSFTVTVQEVNTAPVLPQIGPQTVNELTLLSVTNTATNANIHSVIIGYGLINPPAGASISANGIITWTPGQGQSPSTNVMTTVVTNSNPYDGTNPQLTATNTFTVIVGEVNVAPVLPTIGPQTVSELMLLTVTNTATNANIHSVIIGYGLINPPAGASISANGVMTWTPGQSQSPSTNVITTVVTNSNPYDGVNPQLTATNSFTVIVGEANQTPVLPVIGPQTVNELTLLTVTNTATEPNIHSVEIGYGLINPPAGAVISANGIITWTPSQTQSPSTNVITTVVTNNNPYDLVNPQLTATNSFTVTVQEVNTAPVLPQIGPQTVNELTLLSVTNTATNANIHSVIIGYGLINPPTGASISANGIITWTPSQSQSPSTNTITTVVTNSNPYDLVHPRLTATNSFNVVVQEVNTAPVLPQIGPQTVNELTLLSVTNTATEPNIHSVIIGYGLINPPAGASISANGVITWTPSQTQSPSTNVITTVVTNSNPYDLVNPQLTATNSFTVTVQASVPAFRILSINLSNGIAVVTWNSITGQTYRLQYAGGLNMTNWQNATPDVIASSSISSATNAVNGVPMRFYRIQWIGP